MPFALLRRELNTSHERAVATRKALIACWSSWWSVLSAFAQRCAVPGATERRLLVLEDDRKVHPALLGKLDAVLASLPRRWALVRFDTEMVNLP